MYPFEENVYHKLAFLAIFWAISPHLLIQNGKVWREGANLGLPPPSHICKNRLRGIPLLGKFIPKIANFSDFGSCKLTF